MAAMAAPAVLPIVPLALPAVPHLFVRCTPLGAEPELDYLRVPTGCAVYRAFPALGWLDVSATFPGHVAAPALVLQYIVGAPMHFDWGTAAADAMLRQPELLVMVSLGALARFADAQEGLGVFDKVYRSSQAHLDVLEIALQRCPAPSPFLLGPGELVIHSPFLTLFFSELPSYFGRAQATDLVTGAIPVLRDSWLFDATQAEKLFKGKISEVTWFNLPHGALGLHVRKCVRGARCVARRLRGHVGAHVLEVPLLLG